MEIKKKVLKEVEEIVGYKCDLCNQPMGIDTLFSDLDLSTVKYSVPSGGWGESEETIFKHVCSVQCLKKALKDAVYGANIFLSRELIEKLIK
jgi:hypothetical protein